MVWAMDAPDEQARGAAKAGNQDVAAAEEDVGDLDELLPAVYEELHALAGAVLQHSRTIDPTRTTSLIQDVYVRLANRGLRFRDRAHFLTLAARAMRRVLIDRARRATAIKRGGGQARLPLDDSIVPAADGPDLLAVEGALLKLATIDARKSRIVELRFFGGLSADEIADVTRLSSATVKREWTPARAWLYREIGDGNSSGV
jgi:RNA polymerase sigma factor (TIGR02999 family)